MRRNLCLSGSLTKEVAHEGDPTPKLDPRKQHFRIPGLHLFSRRLEPVQSRAHPVRLFAGRQSGAGTIETPERKPHVRRDLRSTAEE
jgi:hypothetical protein